MTRQWQWNPHPKSVLCPRDMIVKVMRSTGPHDTRPVGTDVPAALLARADEVIELALPLLRRMSPEMAHRDEFSRSRGGLPFGGRADVICGPQGLRLVNSSRTSVPATGANPGPMLRWAGFVLSGEVV